MLVLLVVVGEEITDRKCSRKATALVQPRDKEGLDQGKASRDGEELHSFSRLILNVLEAISEQRILLL